MYQMDKSHKTANQTVSIPVTGMTCANCALIEERNAKKIEGVSEANVNLASEKVTGNVGRRPAGCSW